MKKLLAAGLAVACVLVAVLLFNRPDYRIHVSFLDVGQGSAVLIQQGSTQILIDGGPSPQAVTNELGRRLPYWDRTIEIVVLTHIHEDHLAGLLEVCKRYRVGAVLEPETGIDRDLSALAAEWQAVLAKKNPRIITAESGLEIVLGGVTLTVLNPGVAAVPAGSVDPDGNALVLDLAVGKYHFLLTSDIDRETELDLLYARQVVDCDVLQVAHHGSGLSTSGEFLEVARPELAVISVGENDFGHPSREVLERLGGVTLYRTDINGTVEFITDGMNLWLKTEK